MIVGERVKGGVDTVVKTGANDGLGSVSGNQVARSGNFGSSHRGASTSQSVELKEDFLKYENRLIAYAEKIKLTPDEAKEFLIGKMTSAVGGVLP